MDTEQLASMKAIAEAATPGVWFHCSLPPTSTGSLRHWVEPDGVNGYGDPLASGTTAADADHIATFAPPTVLGLIGEVLRLQGILDRTDPEDSPLAEARQWARHGYEIGQRSATWSDQGVAPEWLTTGHSAAALNSDAYSREHGSGL